MGRVEVNRHQLTPFEAAEVTNAQHTIEKLFSEEQRLLLIELLKRGICETATELE
jgi:hypothetical protein